MSKPPVKQLQEMIKSLKKLADRLEKDYKYYAEKEAMHAETTACGSGVASASGAGMLLFSLAGSALAPVIVPALGVVALGGAAVAGYGGLAGYRTKVAEQSTYDECLKQAQIELPVYAKYLANESSRMVDKRGEDGDNSRVNNVPDILSPFIEAANFSIRAHGIKPFGKAALAVVSRVGAAATAFHLVTLTLNIADFVKNRVAAEQAGKDMSRINSALAMEIWNIEDDLKQELRRQEGA